VPKNRLTVGAMTIDVYANSGVAQYATLVCVANWRLAYKAKHWKNTYTVRYHPRKVRQSNSRRCATPSCQ
jgi:hypothetical protein